MADPMSARPTGESAPWDRSGITLEPLLSVRSRVSKHTISQLLLAAAVGHIFYAGVASGHTANASWPILVLIYGLLAATYRLLPADLFVTAVAPSDDDLSAASDQDRQHQRDQADATHTNLAALRHTVRQQQQQMDSNTEPHHFAGNGQASDWTDLMSQVSHELRTPLNAVIGFSDVMNAELLGPLENPKYREYLSHIRDSGHDLLKSAEDTLAMTSLLANRPSFEDNAHSVNVCDTIHEAWTFIASAAGLRRITLDLMCDPELAIVAEIRPLRQTFINLFSEALKRASDNTAVVLHAVQRGALVEIEMRTFNSDVEAQEIPTPSLAYTIAHALLELQGTTLVASQDACGAWSALTVFECPMQSDFFSNTTSTDPAEDARLSTCTAV